MDDRDNLAGTGEDGVDAPSAILAQAEQDIDAVAAANAAPGQAAAVPNPTFYALITALRNERAAPELLPFEDAVVGQLTYQIQVQKKALDSTSKLALAHNAAVADLYELDLARTRYLVASYLHAASQGASHGDSHLASIGPVLAFQQLYSEIFDVKQISEGLVSHPYIASLIRRAQGSPTPQQWAASRHTRPRL